MGSHSTNLDEAKNSSNSKVLDIYKHINLFCMKFGFGLQNPLLYNYEMEF